MVMSLPRKGMFSHLGVVDPSETDEQALARHQRDRGPIRDGTIYLIRTGVPRSPECRGRGLSAGWTGRTDSHDNALAD
jgi:hypothetical protein